jgi:transposase-like protein
LIRNTFRLASRADHDAIKKDLKAIYTAPTADAAEFALEEFEERWGKKYRAIIRRWRGAWTEFVPFLDLTSKSGGSSAARTPSRASTPATDERCEPVGISPPSKLR